MDGLFESQFYFSEALGMDLIDPELASGCGIPVARQAEQLDRELKERASRSYSVHVVELEDLDDAERHRVIDAVLASEVSPFVLVDGRLVCSGSIDLAAVLAVTA